MEAHRDNLERMSGEETLMPWKQGKEVTDVDLPAGDDKPSCLKACPIWCVCGDYAGMHPLTQV